MGRGHLTVTERRRQVIRRALERTYRDGSLLSQPELGRELVAAGLAPAGASSLQPMVSRLLQELVDRRWAETAGERVSSAGRRQRLYRLGPAHPLAAPRALRRRAEQIETFAAVLTSPAPAALTAGAPRALPAVEDLGWRDLVALLARLAGLPVSCCLSAEGCEDAWDHHDRPSSWDDGLLLVDADPALSSVQLSSRRGDLEIILRRAEVVRARLARRTPFDQAGHLLIGLSGGASLWMQISDAVVDRDLLADLIGCRAEQIAAVYGTLSARLATHPDPLQMSRDELLDYPLADWGLADDAYDGPWPVSPRRRPGRTIWRRAAIELTAAG